MHLIIIQLQRQSPMVFGRFPSVKFFRLNPYRISKDRIMTLALMHPMFQFSSFNWILQSLFTQNCLKNPRPHIVVLAKPKLQWVLSRSCTFEIAREIGFWKCLLECQDWSPSIFLFANCNQCTLWHAVFGEAFKWGVETLQSIFLWKCP